jgi:hypothetical protein
MAMRHSWLSCRRFANMHDLTLAASGMNCEQSRMASGVQAWRASTPPCALAPLRPKRSAPTGNASQQKKRMVRICSFLSVAFSLRAKRSASRKRSRWFWQKLSTSVMDAAGEAGLHFPRST